MNAQTTTEQIARLLKLLPDVATLKVCGAFLKSHNKPHSASGWPEMQDKRFRRLLDSGELAVDDVEELVHECEEFSNKRVHLFKARRGVPKHPIFDDVGVYPKLKNWPKIGVRSIAVVPKSGQQVILEARVEDATKVGDAKLPGALVIKVVTREMRRTLVEERTDGGREFMIYERRAVPIVNVLRLFENGILEIRMDRESDTEAYKGVANAVWTAVAPLISKDDYIDRPVHPILKKIWNPKTRAAVSKSFGMERSDHANGQTNVVATIREPGAVLGNDPDILQTIDLFHQLGVGAGNGCEGAFMKTMVTKKQLEDGLLPLMIQIHGAPNEFSVWAKCRKMDYDWMLSRLLRET